MIDIDGSYGEGGGQILRTAVSLSALSMQPVRITKIRAGRPQPGLKNQHIAAVDLTARLVKAHVSGLKVGSTEVRFEPVERCSGDFSYDVGTAGSISLVLQAALPPAVLSSEPVSFHITGGTDVSWSPPIDYLREIFVKALERIGLAVSLVQERRGHYPAGGGKVSCTVSTNKRILPLDLTDFGTLREIGGISHCVRLPAHVADRQAASAEEALHGQRIDSVHITRESYPKNADPHLGPGSGIVLWAESESRMRVGSDSLGEKGKSAEQVGSDAARALLHEMAAGRAVDSHLCDMLVPYLALAPGESRIGVTEITSHLMTNIQVIEQILGAKVDVQGKIGEPGTLRIRGAALPLRQG
jgi:RNA 3'-phosphate cyclase